MENALVPLLFFTLTCACAFSIIIIRNEQSGAKRTRRYKHIYTAPGLYDRVSRRPRFPGTVPDFSLLSPATAVPGNVPGFL